jgi:hypothetical protein
MNKQPSSNAMREEMMWWRAWDIINEPRFPLRVFVSVGWLIVLFTAAVVGLLELYQIMGSPNQAAIDSGFQKCEEQLRALTNMEGSVRALDAFIVDQKHQLSVRREMLQVLQSQHDELKPIVEADRQAVEKILDAMQQRIWAGVWEERCISYFLGILSSATVAYLFPRWFSTSTSNDKSSLPSQPIQTAHG